VNPPNVELHVTNSIKFECEGISTEVDDQQKTILVRIRNVPFVQPHVDGTVLTEGQARALDIVINSALIWLEQHYAD